MSVAPTTKYITVAAATGTVTINATDLFSRYVVETSGSVSLAANLTFSLSGTPFEGQTICFDLPGTITNGAFTFTVLGVPITAEQALKRCSLYFRWSVSAGAWYVSLTPDFSQTEVVSSDNVISVALGKITQSVGVGSLIRGTSTSFEAFSGGELDSYFIIGNGTKPVPCQFAGDFTVAQTPLNPNLSVAVSTISNGAITNAKVAAAAAIARTKLANGTADHVLINDGSGTMSSEATLNVSRGGTGLDNSAATGLQKYAAGTPSVGFIVAADVTANTLTPSTLTQEARTEVLNFTVSFETGEQCDNKILMPYAGSVVTIYATVVKAIAGTDSATITPKNQAGTTMTDGVVTFSASTALNTAVTTTPTANNTFVAGDVLSFTTAKTTAGGRALISIVVERS